MSKFNTKLPQFPVEKKKCHICFTLEVLMNCINYQEHTMLYNEVVDPD